MKCMLKLLQQRTPQKISQAIAQVDEKSVNELLLGWIFFAKARETTEKHTDNAILQKKVYLKIIFSQPFHHSLSYLIKEHFINLSTISKEKSLYVQL